MMWPQVAGDLGYQGALLQRDHAGINRDIAELDLGKPHQYDRARIEDGDKRSPAVTVDDHCRESFLLVRPLERLADASSAMRSACLSRSDCVTKPMSMLWPV